MPQDPHVVEFKASHGKGDCKAVISGLLCGKPMRWEVAFDIQPFLKGREREEKVHEDLWNETFHHLAGLSIIQDFEHMADKECEIEHGKFELPKIKPSNLLVYLTKSLYVISCRFWETVPDLRHPHEQSLQHLEQIHSVCAYRSGQQ